MTDAPHRRFAPRDGAVILFSASLLVSAFLLMLVQPMFAKMILPRFGGSPSVWNTCMVFFQVGLLAGYLYSHLTTQWLGVRRQAAWHLLLLTVPLTILPIAVPAGWRPPLQSGYVEALLSVLAYAVGLPFLLVATSAPLLQTWFARCRRTSSRDPYFLYAASNVGSLAALLCYPTIIEPRLRLAQQSQLWAIGYLLLVLMTTACAITMWASTGRHRDATDPIGPITDAPPPTTKQRALWVALAAVPSSLLLGVTTYFSTDIAAVPLLWVVPLALYLLTYIIAFSGDRPRWQAVTDRILPFLMLILCVQMMTNLNQPAWAVVVLHLCAFFVAALVCHQRLATSRPPAKQLTEFYLWISVGGALGGIFNALLAPLLFKTVLEYPLAIAFACWLSRGYPSDTPLRRQRLADYLVPTTVLLLTGLFKIAQRAASSHGATAHIVTLGLLCLVPAIICYACRYRPLRFGLAIGAWLAIGSLASDPVLDTQRSFFGVYRVRQTAKDYHALRHGTTIHGLQCLRADRRREPLTYFTRTGPVGQVFDQFADGSRRLHSVAVIGLGTGSLACYATPGQDWTYYEIDPTVVGIATNPAYFTFVRDCLESFHVVLGDARLSLADAPDRAYDLLIVDAFSSDSIPIHLLTREAMRLYFSKLSEHGVLVLHISNRYLGLQPVIGDMARSLGLVCFGNPEVNITPAEMESGKVASHWLVVARQPDDLRGISADARWKRVEGRADARVWSDDFSNVLSAFHWH